MKSAYCFTARAALSKPPSICSKPPAWGLITAAPGKRLGDVLKLMGEAGRALQAYQHATKYLPGQAAVYYSLGTTLNALGRRKEAAGQLTRALKLNPHHASARYLLCALQGHTPPRAPNAYVRRLFDRYAVRFDRHMRGPLAYKVPARLAKELARRRGGRRIYRNGLDLGCGTGLTGEVLRPWTRRLTGVDISPAMLAEARSKKIYDRLACQDIVIFLDKAAEHFDLIVAADVLIYIGDIQPLFAAASRRLSPAGRLMVSTEATRCHPFRLRCTGRFAHHPGYVSDLAAKAGFEIEKKRRLAIRQEHDRMVHGDLFIFAPKPNRLPCPGAFDRFLNNL